MLQPRRIGRICLAIAAVLSMPVAAAAQQWFGTPADVYWVPLPNRPDLLPPGGKSPDPLTRCRTALRFAGQFHTPIAGALEACPMLARAIEWEQERGWLQPYVEWDVARQERLEDLFQRLLDHRSNLGLSCPDTSVAMPSLNNVYLTEDEAFGIYAAHVAHVIYLEATRRVPWSILNVPHEELRILLASPSYFVRVLDKPSDAPPHSDPDRLFRLPQRAYFGDGLVCDPRVGYWFLSGATSTGGENLIGATEEETLARIGVWMARDVAHGGVLDVARDVVEDWTLEHQRQHSYLQDRLKRRAYSSFPGEPPFPGLIMAVGCHSAASFIHDLAKSLNIPLLAVLASETPNRPNGPFHQGLLFHSARKDRRILWHADDFYLATRPAPYFPIDASGRPLAPAAALRLFFDVNFVAPDVLVAHGFEWFPVPEPYPGPFVFGQPVIGQWPLTGARVPLLGYVYDRRYDLCAWNNFVEDESWVIDYKMANSFRVDGPWPLLHPLESFGAHADACAAAYGGRDVLTAAADAHFRARGANVYSATPIRVLPPGLSRHIPR